MSRSDDEWLQQNFRGCINELEKTRKQLDDQLNISKGLQNTVTKLSQDVMILTQRVNVLQHGQVQGSTSVKR